MKQIERNTKITSVARWTLVDTVTHTHILKCFVCIQTRAYTHSTLLGKSKSNIKNRLCECVQPKRMNCGVKHESGKKRHKKKIERNAASIRGKKEKKIARVWVAHLERWGYNWRPTSHRVRRTQMYGSGSHSTTHMDSKNNHSCIRHCMYWDKWVSEWVVIVMQSSRHRKRVHRRHGGRCFVVFPNNNKHIDRRKKKQ